MTSQGLDVNGMDPYIDHYAQSACYATPQSKENGAPNAPWMVTNPDANLDSEADCGDWFPVANIKHKTRLGYKYFNFDEGAQGSLKLSLQLIEETTATINVYTAVSRAQVSDPKPERTNIGTIELAGTDAQVHELSLPADVSVLIGRGAIYLEFISDVRNEEGKAVEACQTNKLRFDAE